MYSGFIEILPSGPVVISNFPYLRFACSRTAGGLILNGALSISNTPDESSRISCSSFWHRDAVSLAHARLAPDTNGFSSYSARKPRHSI